jgi:serine protease Do
MKSFASAVRLEELTTPSCESKCARSFTAGIGRGLLIPLLLLTAANAQQPNRAPDNPPQSKFNILRELDNSMESLSDAVGPSVVQILVSAYGPKGEDDLEAQIFVHQHAIGSGIIVDPDGYIMTNNHVVGGAQRVRVVLPAVSGDSSGRTIGGKKRIFDAEIVGTDPEGDLALIKINAHDLPVLPLDVSRKVRQGQLVFAIGSPEGLPSTVTMGVVSAVSRQVEAKDPMVYIQTDSSINPGNSGGPLVDREGYLVGMNTFIISESGGSSGLGFAIPAPTVKFVYESLRKYGYLRRAAIQARTQTITPTVAKGLGLSQPWGVIVSDVTPGGAADNAGLREGDIVQAMDNQEVDTVPGYYSALYVHPVDQVLLMRILRGKQVQTLSIPVIEHRRPIQQLTELANLTNNAVPNLGIVAIDLDDKLKGMMPDLRSTSGAVVAVRIPDARDIQTGLRVGDVIRSLNQVQIDSFKKLQDAAIRLKDGDPVVLQIEREGHLQYLGFEID